MQQERRGRLPVEGRLMLIVALVMSFLIVVPGAAVLVRAFLARDVGFTLSLHNYRELFTDPAFFRGLFNTLTSAALAAVLASCLGTVLAWIVARTDTPLQRVFSVLNLVPFFLSPYVGALAWSILAAPKSGLLNRLLMSWLGRQQPVFNVYSLGGMVWVLALFYAPYVYLFTLAPLQSMDPSLEEAARTHGASGWQTVRRVTLPMLTPAILSGLLIAFVTAAEVFDVPINLTSPVGIPTLPTAIFESLQFPPNYNRAAAISTVLVTITLLGVWAQRKLQGARSYVTVTGKAYRPRRVRLGRMRIVALLFELAYVLVGVILPLLSLSLVAVSRVWTGTFKPGLFTWNNFRYVLFSYDLTRRSLVNSLILAVLGATLGVAVAVVASYAIHRTRYRWRHWFEAIAAIPTGVPGLVLALGFLLIFIRTPLYGTLWIILLAYVTRFFPYSQRSVGAMLQAIGPELEQSARVSGASWFTTMRRILLPLMRNGLLATWMMLFVIFVRELSTSVLLFQSGTETMSVAMLIISQRNLSYVAAFALVQTLILLVASTVFIALGRLGEGVQP